MLNITQEQDVTVVEFSSEYASLTCTTVDRIVLELSKTARLDGTPRMVLDLSQVTSFETRFLEVLVRLWKILKKRQGCLVLCGLSPFCSKVLKNAKLDSLWKVCETRSEAIAAAIEQYNANAMSQN